MSQKHCTRQRAARVRSARALATVGSVLAAGTLFSSGVSAKEVLPKPEPPFKGKIGRTYKDSQPDKIPVTKAPAGAPNVLMILIDDVNISGTTASKGRYSIPFLCQHGWEVKLAGYQVVLQRTTLSNFGWTQVVNAGM